MNFTALLAFLAVVAIGGLLLEVICWFAAAAIQGYLPPHYVPVLFKPFAWTYRKIYPYKTWDDIK